MALYLGIPPKSELYKGFNSFPIANLLTQWLRSCCTAHSNIQVATITAPRPMNSLDGLVYLVGYQSASILDRLGVTGSQDVAAGQVINYRGTMLAEVYVNILSVYGAAATVYHELLHNKFKGAVAKVHNLPGGNFTSAVAPFSEGGPSEADQKLMCEALTMETVQFQGGFYNIAKSDGSVYQLYK